jgi:hypothetical protein
VSWWGDSHGNDNENTLILRNESQLDYPDYPEIERYIWGQNLWKCTINDFNKRHASTIDLMDARHSSTTNKLAKMFKELSKDRELKHDMISPNNMLLLKRWPLWKKAPKRRTTRTRKSEQLLETNYFQSEWYQEG